MPLRISAFLADSDSVTAPKAEDSSAVEVTPICTAARNRFGSASSRATAWPRRPDSAIALDLALAQRHQRDLGGHEQPLDQDQRQHDADVEHGAVHRVPQFDVAWLAPDLR